MYLDQNGLLVTSTMDGGDTAQNEGMYWLFDSLSNRHFDRQNTFKEVMSLLEPNKDGLFIRNPLDWNKTTDFSRDQARSIIVAMGHLKLYKPLLRMLWKQILRFTLFPNKDIASPQNWGEYIRALKFFPFYPILFLGDIFMLLDTLNICFIKARIPGPIQYWLGKHIHWIFIQGESNNDYGVPRDSYGPDNVGTDKNHIASLLQARLYFPTPISFLARKIYKKFRPMGALYSLRHYFRHENIEIAELAESVLEKYL